MRKYMLVACLGLIAVLAFAGCGSTSTGNGGGNKLKYALPTGTPLQPVGATAITPTSKDTPAFTKDDVIRYVKTHNIPFNIASLSDISSVQVSFITSKEVNDRLNRSNTNIPDNYLLCFVELTGKFEFPGPPDANGKPTLGVYQSAYEVFDAKTGNLLLGGGLGEAT
jgi:hypothetical protein